MTPLTKQLAIFSNRLTNTVIDVCSLDPVSIDYSYSQYMKWTCHLMTTKCGFAFEGQNSVQVINLSIFVPFLRNAVVDLYVELIDQSGTFTSIS